MERSDTPCPLCNDIETPLVLQLWDWLTCGVGHDTLKAMHAMADVLQAATMGMLGETWYDHHRRRFEATGDDRELTRMMRHVGI